MPPSPVPPASPDSPRTPKDARTRPRRRVSEAKGRAPRVGPSTGDMLHDMPISVKRKVQRIIYGATGDPQDQVLLARAMDKGIKHTRPFGARDAFSRGVMALVAVKGEGLLRRVAEDQEMADWWMAALRKGVQLGDATCMSLYGKLMKLAGEEQKEVHHFLHSIGMQSVDEVRAMAETFRDHADVTPEQRAAVCADYLEMYVNANPVEREAFVRRLGGEVVQRSDSYVEVLGAPSGKP